MPRQTRTQAVIEPYRDWSMGLVLGSAHCRQFILFITDKAGTWADGDTVTQAGGASAILTGQNGSNILVVSRRNGFAFRWGVAVTSSSGGTATVISTPLNNNPVSDAAIPYGENDGNRAYNDQWPTTFTMPDATSIKAAGWTGGNLITAYNATDWSVHIYDDYGVLHTGYFLRLPGTTGHIGHAIESNADGVTLIHVTKIYQSTETDFSIQLKTASDGAVIGYLRCVSSGAGAVQFFNASHESLGVLRNTGDGNIQEYYLLIDWAAQIIRALHDTKVADAGTDRSYSTLGSAGSTIAVSQDLAYGAAVPAWLEITNNAAGEVQLRRVKIMDDPWLLIGDSRTYQCERASGCWKLISYALSETDAVVNIAEGSTGLVYNGVKSYRDLATIGQLDKFRFARVCVATLGINDWNTGKTLQQMTAAVDDTATALSFGSIAKQVVWCEEPAANLSQANYQALHVPFAAHIRRVVLPLGNGSCVPDLLSATVADKTANVVALRPDLAHTTENGVWGTQGRDLHLTKAGCALVAATIAKAIARAQAPSRCGVARLGL